MTTLGEVLKGIRETNVLNDRVEQLTKKIDQREARERDHAERLVRVETFFELVRPALAHRGFPPRG